MKKIVIALSAVFLSLTAVNCGRDMTGEAVADVNQLPGESFIIDNATAIGAANGIYNKMQDRYVYGGELHLFDGLYADDFRHSGTFSEFGQAAGSNFLENNLSIQRIWSGHYGAIGAANVLIDQLETKVNSKSSVTTDVKNKSLGEAYAARGLMHFNLVRLFGKVPYVSTPVYSNTQVLYPKREEVSAVYTKIKSDLNKAIAFFSLSDNTSTTRLNLNAAKVILADVHMHLNEMSQAKALLEPMANIELPSNYWALYGSANTSEDIFKVAFADGDGGNHAFFLMPAALGGRGEVALRSPEFTSIFSSNDKRIDPVTASFPVAQGRVYSKKYSNAGTGADQAHVYRGAKVLLMLAEARLSAGGDALTLVNKVRARAGLEALTSVSISDIVLERRRELYAEADRWFTVKRLGLSKSVIEGKGANYISERNDLWPIPAYEIDNNPEFKGDQNKGY
ncbi:RagB/SusD family nutrient uptake outer membrane protein [Riemerella anatipestifer]|uniref:RagB/SusD family nutrient uptake outer membrane protein n=1 Tax=Riemerella anatipestifer TaxID=34085 RepID=UPI002A89415E|nr:RagB/SusD family nutrient uptake outer membrane protein [Riemerella anatipestifer]